MFRCQLSMQTSKWRQIQIVIYLAGLAVVLQSHLCDAVLIPFMPSFIRPLVPARVKLDPETVDILQESSQDPEVRPGLFEGDMALDDITYDRWRVGLSWNVYPDKKWKNGIVPYHISALYDPSDYVTIYKAIRLINFMTCVKFVPWNGISEDALLIWPIKYPAGCWSFVGKTGGLQLLSLQPPDENGPNCLGNEARAIHELMHALGIFHEQSRPDRDKFVTVHFDNIVPAFKRNFNKQSSENTTHTYEYDFDSIMHYGTNYFAKFRGKPTLTPNYPGVNIGQRKGLSKTDCLKINDLYGCLKNQKIGSKYFSLCQNLGL